MILDLGKVSTCDTVCRAVRSGICLGSTPQRPDALPEGAVFQSRALDRVGLSHLGSGLTQSEDRLSEIMLITTNPEHDTTAQAKVLGEQFAIPHA